MQNRHQQNRPRERSTSSPLIPAEILSKISFSSHAAALPLSDTDLTQSSRFFLQEMIWLKRGNWGEWSVCVLYYLSLSSQSPYFSVFFWHCHFLSLCLRPLSCQSVFRLILCKKQKKKNKSCFLSRSSHSGTGVLAASCQNFFFPTIVWLVLQW